RRHGPAFAALLDRGLDLGTAHSPLPSQLRAYLPAARAEDRPAGRGPVAVAEHLADAAPRRRLRPGGAAEPCDHPSLGGSTARVPQRQAVTRGEPQPPHWG